MAAKEKKVYFQTFKLEYKKDFPWIKPSKLGEKYAFCEICRTDISISHAGRYDIVRHKDTSKHLRCERSSSSSSKLDSFFKDSNQNDVIKAELLFTSFLVEHNVPLAAADHVGPLLRKMFPKCEEIKQYGCARTKTTALVGEMARTKKEEMIECMKSGPFTAGCDGSNDSDFKLYPIVVTHFDKTDNRIKSSLFSMPNLSGDSTGENIANLLVSEFQRNAIPLEHMIAFMADNARVMQGKKLGCAAFLKKQHNNLIAIGCACHLINLASEKGAATLPVKVDEILVDVFYYLEKSAKRKEALKEFQALHNKEAKKILKHCSTRWLSLGRSLLRFVEQWDPLLSFFKNAVKLQSSKISSSLSTYTIPQKKIEKNGAAEKACSSTEKPRQKSTNKRKCEKQDNQISKKQILEKSKSASLQNILSREEKIFMFLSSDVSKAYCLFLLNVIPTFDSVNIALQSGHPLIHKLREIYLELLKELYCRFVKPSVVKSNELLSVQYHSKENQKENDDLVIGHQTAAIVQKLSEVQKKTFYSSIRNFYTSSCDYIVNKFPINDETLKNAEVADTSKLDTAKFSSVRYFINLFPCLLNESEKQKLDEKEIDDLQKQFCSLQMENISSIVESNKHIDEQWVHIGNLKNSSGVFKYKNLSKVMLSILLIPHSNAECERVFSVVKKNRNEFRATMSNKTLENLLILKTNNQQKCHEQTFTQEFLQRAKKATSASLKLPAENY